MAIHAEPSIEAQGLKMKKFSDTKCRAQQAKGRERLSEPCVADVYGRRGVGIVAEVIPPALVTERASGY